MSKVLIYDCDGVLGDTEQDGHLPAFNRMWRELGVPWQWSVEEYGRKLKIGGGKERMSSLFQEADFLKVFTPPAGEQGRSRAHDKAELSQSPESHSFLPQVMVGVARLSYRDQNYSLMRMKSIREFNSPGPGARLPLVPGGGIFVDDDTPA